MRFLVGALALVAASGCVQTASPDAPFSTPGTEPFGTTAPSTTPALRMTPRPDTSTEEQRPAYWFVQFQGTYERTHDEGTGGICGFPSPPDIDTTARTVHFHNEWFFASQRLLLAAGHTWDSSLCGVAVPHVLHDNGTHGQVTGPIPGFGNITVVFAEGDFIMVLDTLVPAHANATFTRSGDADAGHTFTASLTVTNHGRWPLAGLSFGRAPEP